MAKKIRLQQASITSIKNIIKDAIVTQIHFTTAFDQLAADNMEQPVRDTVYDQGGHRRGGFRQITTDIEMFGVAVELIPEQGTLFAKKFAEGITLEAVKLDATKILKQKADETLKLSFTLTVAGIPREILDFVEILKKSTCKCIIDQPTKAKSETAKEQAATLGLFKVPKEPAEDGEGEKDEEPEKPRGRAASKDK